MNWPPVENSFAVVNIRSKRYKNYSVLAINEGVPFHRKARLINSMQLNKTGHKTFCIITFWEASVNVICTADARQTIDWICESHDSKTENFFKWLGTTPSQKVPVKFDILTMVFDAWKHGLTSAFIHASIMLLHANTEGVNVIKKKKHIQGI